MSEEAMQPGPQPQANVKNLSMGDHTPEAYAQALNATCQKTLDREHNTGANNLDFTTESASHSTVAQYTV